MEEEKLMDIKEFSKFINAKISKVRKMIFKKEIAYYKYGTLIRIKRTDAIKWIESKRVNSKQGGFY